MIRSLNKQSSKLVSLWHHFEQKRIRTGKAYGIKQAFHTATYITVDKDKQS